MTMKKELSTDYNAINRYLFLTRLNSVMHQTLYCTRPIPFTRIHNHCTAELFLSTSAVDSFRIETIVHHDKVFFNIFIFHIFKINITN